MCAFFLPETYAPVLLKQKAQHLRRSTGDQRYWHPHEKEKIELSTVVSKRLARPLKWVELTILIDSTRTNLS
jgi:DHA1 family multidrug resistance protein-like MFS transporter